MKKLILLFLVTTSLFAVDGQKIFDDNCKKCHFMSLTNDERKQHFKNGTIKAPMMIGISNRLRTAIVINVPNDNAEEIHRFAVISYIKEYLKNPSWDYYMCDNPAINRFGVMPAQSHLKEEELQAVAEWIYDYFEDKEMK